MACSFRKDMFLLLVLLVLCDTASTVTVTSSKEVLVNTAAAITCTTTGLGANSGYSVKWTVDGTDYSSTDTSAGYTITNTDTSISYQSVLSIASSNTGADKTVQCKVTANSAETSTNGYLRTFSIASSSKEVRTGTTATLTCDITGLTVSTSKIKWSRAGAEYTQQDNADNENYQVNAGSISSNAQRTTLALGGPVTSADAVFTCMVQIDGEWFSETNVQLNTFSQIISPVGSETLRNTAVTVTCTVRDLTDQTVSFQWSRGGNNYDTGTFSKNAGYTIVNNKVSTTVQTSMLTISSANMGTDFTLGCMAFVDDAWFTVEKDIQVYDIAVSSAEVKNGTNTRLTCTVNYASTRPTTISWVVPESGTFTKDTLDKSSFAVTQSENEYHIIASVIETKNPQKDKQYTCTVDYDGLTSVATANLNVFEIHVGDTAVMAGETITLRCDIEGHSTTRSQADQYWTDSIGTKVTSNVGWNQAAQFGSLGLSNIQKDARYNCHYKVDGTWYERQALVDVFSVEVVDDVVTPGMAATPHCHTYGLTLPIAYFTWSTSSNTAITSGLSKSGANGRDADTLTATVTTDKSYKCTINVMTYVNTMKTWTFNVKVDVVELSTGNVIARDGTQAVLSCDMTGAQRAMDSYTWATPASTSSSDYTDRAVTVNLGTEYRLEATLAASSFTKNQGTWTCSYVFDRSISMNKKRTLSTSLSFDIAKWTKVPVVTYVNTGSTATYTCKGTATSATGIKPTYVWTVNGVTTAAAMNSDTSILTFSATDALDGKTVECTARWTSVSSVELTAGALLYSKYIHVFPKSAGSASATSTLVGVKGEDLVVTCLYSSRHKQGSVWWYKGTGTNRVRITGGSLYSMSSGSSTTSTESYTLTLKSVSQSTLGTYSCVYKFSGAGDDWSGQVVISDMVSIDSFTQVGTADLISGYSAILRASIAHHFSSLTLPFSSITYKVYRGSNVLSHASDGSNAVKANTGQVIYRTQRDTDFDVEVTWTGAYQTLVTTWSKLNGKRKLRIVDSCAVTHSNINSITSLNNNDDYVVTNTAIKASCSKGYIMPSGRPYTRTCSADTTMTFDTCTGGCYITDLASNSKSSHDFKDSYKLLGTGYTTTHYNTEVELNCGTDYTLPRASPKTLTCNSNSAKELAFSQKCVVGCKWTKANTAFSYLHHDKTLIAGGDSVTYTCNTNTMTNTGADSYTQLCDATAATTAFTNNNAAMTLSLSECQAFTMVAPTFDARSNSAKVTFATPSYPAASVQKIVVRLLSSGGYYLGVTRTVNSASQVAFFNLNTETVYRIKYMVYYANGGKYTSAGEDTFTTTAVPAQPTVSVSNALTVDVPQIDYTPYSSTYGMLVVYRKDEYIGDVSNMRFVPVFDYHGDFYGEWSTEAWSTEKGNENEVTVYVYPTSDSLYEAGIDLGAFYADSIAVSALASASYSYSYSNIDMKRSATYYFILRGCTDSTNSSCSDGSPGIVDMSTNHDKTILAAFFTTLLLLLLFAFLIFLFIKCKVWYRDGRKKKRQAGSTYGVSIRNPRYGY